MLVMNVTLTMKLLVEIGLDLLRIKFLPTQFYVTHLVPFLHIDNYNVKMFSAIHQ